MLSLADMVRLNALRVPYETAIVWHEVRLNYKELNSRTSSLANALTSMGVVKGDRVALLATNCSEYIEVHVACSKTGAILVPLNALLAPGEISRLLNHSGAKVLFLTANFADMINKLRPDIPQVKGFIAIGNGEGMKDYETLTRTFPPTDPLIPVGEDDIAYITYTSGTTGLPKGVMLSVRNLFSNAVNAIVSCLVPPGGVEVVSFPLFFSAIFNSHVIPFFLAGGGVVILDRFRPDALIEAINQEKPNYTTMNPTMLHDFVTHPKFSECDLRSLRGILVAAAPLSLSRMQEAKKALGSILVQGYGLTECTSFATCTWAEDYDVEDQAKLAKRVTSIGRACPTLQLRVVNEQGGDVAQDGEAVGEIIIKGPSVMPGYWKQPEATAEVIKDGWLYTGDLGTMDGEGYLWVVGRKKDMINSGGFKVYPEEVESILYTMSRVQEVAVIGRPDERWGETVTAIVVPKSGISLNEAEVIQFTRDRLASYKKPTRVLFVSQLPRNASGKVKKHELREMLRRGELK